jgi:hypothetical protein
VKLIFLSILVEICKFLTIEIEKRSARKDWCTKDLALNGEQLLRGNEILINIKKNLRMLVLRKVDFKVHFDLVSFPSIR